MRILCGDIGGTKTRLAICETDTTGVRIAQQRDYPSAAYGSLEAPLDEFLAGVGAPCDAACFAVAGPVQGQCCQTTNLPWTVVAAALASHLGIERLRLLNDLEAAAWGIAGLSEADTYRIQAGEPDPQGNRSVIAAGTGLGEAGLYWDGQRHRPFASEGGHADFAPADEREYRLLQYLATGLDHVSWERVVSGMGIVSIHAFLCEYRGREAPPTLRQEMASGDPAAAISRAAIQGTCPLCRETLELFLTLYGREAGNQALKLMATGGVFLAGGIAPKLLGLLRGPTFLQAFCAKGRMEPLMRRMPVHLVLNDRVPILGAALAMSA